MKNIFYNSRSSLRNILNGSDAKMNKPENLPELIKSRNDFIVKAKDLIDPIDKILEKEDPLKLRINLTKPDYIQEYYKSLTMYDALCNKIKRLLLFLRLKNRREYFTSIERRIDDMNMKPNFSYIMDPRRSYLKNYQMYFISAVIFFILGYLWARLRYDVYFRRIGYTLYPTFMIRFEQVDLNIKKVEDKIEYYFPRNMTESEYEYLFYKYIQEYKEEKKLNRKIKKYAYIDEDVFNLDKILGNIRV